MGPFPQMMLAALILAAFALASQQRLAIASHGGPAPARQIAYLLRSHHSAAVSFKLANPATTQTIVAGEAGMTGFISCADAKTVVTTIDQSYGTARDQQIAGELLRQSVSSGQTGVVAPGGGVPGIGLSDGTQLQTGFGAVALPAACPVTAGLPAMQTRVLP